MTESHQAEVDVELNRQSDVKEVLKIIIKDDNDGGFQIPIPDEDTLSKLQATSVTYRFATGKSKGKLAAKICICIKSQCC